MLDLKRIDIQTAKNGNPANIPNKHNSGVDDELLWTTNNLIPDTIGGLINLYGEPIVYHLGGYFINYTHEVDAKDQNRYNGKVLEAQLRAWTKIVVSGKAKGTDSIFMPCPIQPGQQFVALSNYYDYKAYTIPPNIAGIGMLSAIGQKLHLETAAIELAVDAIATSFDVERKYVAQALRGYASKTRYTYKAVLIAALTQNCAVVQLGTDSPVYLVDSHVYECMQEMYGPKDVAPNVVSVDSNWNRFLDWKVQPCHISWYLNSFYKDMPKMYGNKKRFINMETYILPDNDVELHIVFEGVHRLIVNKQGVFEDDRNRQLYNAVVVNHQAVDYTTDAIRPADIRYQNSYAVLLEYLVINAANFAATVPYMSQFFSKRLLNELTFVAVEDTGKPDSDRRMLEKSTTITKVSNDYVSVWKEGHETKWKEHTTSPFNFTNFKNGENFITLERHFKGIRKNYVAPWRVDEVAFTELNLARSKEHFIDGRLVALQAKFIPVDARIAVVQLICNRAYGTDNITSLEGAIYKDFPELIAAQYTSEELWALICEELVFGLSSKLSKLVKRCIMFAAQIGDLLEAEDVCIKQRTQIDSSDNCQAIKSIVTCFHNAAQGMAVLLDHNDGQPLLHHNVAHRIERKLSLKPMPIGIVANTVTLDFESYMGPSDKSYVEDSWTIYNFSTPVPKKFGEQLLAMPFQPLGFGGPSAGGIENFNLLCDEDDAMVHQIRVRYVTLAGKMRQVHLQVFLKTLEHGVKGRGITKSMLGTVNPNVAFNALNPNLEVGAVDGIFYKDTNKWLDTTLNLMPMVYMTAHKNAAVWPEAIEIIKAIDETAGDNNWSPLLDLMGTYEPLRAAFDAKFGKEAVWLQQEEVGCDKEQSCIAHEYRLYKDAEGWTSFDLPSNIDAAIPAQYTNIFALIQGAPEDFDNNKINVLVFGCNETGTNWYKAQRSRVYMGTAECPLYMPVKAEMASVRASVGTSPAMGGTIRAVSTFDPAFAAAMSRKNYKNYDKFAGFLGMSRSSSVQPADGLEVFETVVLNESGRLSPEAAAMLRSDKVKDLLRSTENENKFLLELSKLFNKVTFVIKTGEVVKENNLDEDEVGTYEQKSFSLYLPIVVAQSAAVGFKTTDDLSSNVSLLFTTLVHGGDWLQNSDGELKENPRVVNLSNRIGGAIRSLAKTKGIAKCGSFGVMGVMAKPIGLYGVPLNEVWIKKCERYDSVYKTLLRTFKLKGSQLDQYPVLISRAPMTATGKIRVRVIDIHHDMYNYVAEDGFTFNPLACYFHRGDYDGDLNYLYPGILDGIEVNVPTLTVSALIESIKSSTGDDQMRPGASYYGDGFEIPTWKSVVKKRTFKSESITLNINRANMLDALGGVKPSLGQLLSGSTRMLREAVGIAHRLFITTDLFITTVTEFEAMVVSEFKPSQWINIKLIQILAEIYEVPLGGFDKWAYIVFYGYIIPALKSQGLGHEFLSDAIAAGICDESGSAEYKSAVNLIESGLALPNGKVEAGLKTISGVMNKANMNGTIVIDLDNGIVDAVADNVNSAIEMVNICQGWKGNPKQIQDVTSKEFHEWGDAKYHLFFSLAAEISFLISKGGFLPEVTKSGAADYVTSSTAMSFEDMLSYGIVDTLSEYEAIINQFDGSADIIKDISLQRKMLNAYIKAFDACGMNSDDCIANSVVFGPIEYYRKTVCAALIGKEVLVDTSFFIAKPKAEVVEEAIEVEATEVIDEDDDDALLDAFDAFVKAVG
jgi:hypothetical protein